MKRKGDRYSMQTSLIVAALKRLLPIGLNICAPGDQELIALAKNRFSLVSLRFLPVDVIFWPPDPQRFDSFISMLIFYLHWMFHEAIFLHRPWNTDIKTAFFFFFFLRLFISKLCKSPPGHIQKSNRKDGKSLVVEKKWISYEVLYKIWDGKSPADLWRAVVQCQKHNVLCWLWVD